MKIEKIATPPLQANVYFVKHHKECLIVDPSGPIEDLLTRLENFSLSGIFLTHGHIDHISALNEIHEYFPNTPIWTHAQEQKYFQDARWNLSLFIEMQERVWNLPFQFLTSGSMLNLLGSSWKALHTPGHTEGSLCFYQEEERILFSGDVLFANSIGRTDFPGGSSTDLQNSLKLLYNLPDATTIYPGHGDSTTIGTEKERNSFFK